MHYAHSIVPQYQTHAGGRAVCRVLASTEAARLAAIACCWGLAASSWLARSPVTPVALARAGAEAGPLAGAGGSTTGGVGGKGVAAVLPAEGASWSTCTISGQQVGPSAAALSGQADAVLCSQLSFGDVCLARVTSLVSMLPAVSACLVSKQNAGGHLGEGSNEQVHLQIRC